MSSFIKNYGFSKTIIHDNNNTNNNLHNEIEWIGQYDGRLADIYLDMNNNGNRNLITMQLNNNDIRQIFGIQPIEVPLETRLRNNFLSDTPITLEGALLKKKTRRYNYRKKHHKRTKTKRLY